jgi:hypothetical protein
MARSSATFILMRLNSRSAKLASRPQSVDGRGQSLVAGGPALSRAAATGILVANAGLALVFGMLVYMSDRPPSHAALVPMALTLGAGSLFGTVGYWLPSFVHPFSFSLLSAALCSPTSAPAYRACAAWWVVNVVFEVGQHPQIGQFVVENLHATFGTGWLAARLVSNYLLRGTFDVGDLIAVTLGSLAAAMVLYVTHRWEVSRAS